MKRGSYFVLVLLILVLLSNFISCVTVKFYEGKNFQGDSLNYNMSYKNQTCINLPDNWTRNVSSVNAGDLCMILFLEANCADMEPAFLYHGSGHWDLLLWGIDNSLSSVKVCDENIEKKPGLKENSILVYYIYEPRRLLTIHNCETFHRPLKLSINAIETYGTCYLFYEESNCKGKHYPDSINPDAEIKSIKHCLQQKHKNSDSTDSGSPINITLIFIAVFTITLFVAVVIAIAFCMFKTINNQKHTIVQLEQKNDEFIHEFINGNPNAFKLMPYDNADAIYRATNTPYDSNTYEIPLNNLTMDQTFLGAGEFGMVVKAKLTSPKFPEPFDVAVKVVKPGVQSSYVKALLDECKIMMYLNSEDKHEHIVNLVGACTENLDKLEPYVIIEFCNNGSMDKYLRSKRGQFKSLLIENQTIYPPNLLSNDETEKINTTHLVTWSAEIADGMSYLARKKVIHGDLAARNVLLDYRHKAKICDFGYSRRMYQYSQYVKTQQAPLPWRWMAIESLEDMMFSTQSDVWAFGVTLWEIFTLARTPYPGILWDAQFLKGINDGLRLSKPEYAPSSVYGLMLKCWAEIPNERPSFEELTFLLSNAWENNTKSF